MNVLADRTMQPTNAEKPRRRTRRERKRQQRAWNSSCRDTRRGRGDGAWEEGRMRTRSHRIRRPLLRGESEEICRGELSIDCEQAKTTRERTKQCTDLMDIIKEGGTQSRKGERKPRRHCRDKMNAKRAIEEKTAGSRSWRNKTKGRQRRRKRNIQQMRRPSDRSAESIDASKSVLHCSKTKIRDEKECE